MPRQRSRKAAQEGAWGPGAPPRRPGAQAHPTAPGGPAPPPSPPGSARRPAARPLTSAADAPGRDPPAGSAGPGAAWSGGAFPPEAAGAGPPACGTGRGLHPTVRGEPAPRAPRPEPCGAQCRAPPRVGVCFSCGASVSRQGPARRGHPESSHPVTSGEQIVYLMPAQCWATLEGTTEINLSWFFSSGCSSRLGNAITF